MARVKKTTAKGNKKLSKKQMEKTKGGAIDMGYIAMTKQNANMNKLGKSPMVPGTSPIG